MVTKNLIVANWKMNSGFEEVEKWFGDFVAGDGDFGGDDVVVCPPFTLIEAVSSCVMGYAFEVAEKEVAKSGKNVDDLSEEEFSKAILGKRLFAIGAQDCHYEAKGAFTGDVSASMVASIGCEYVILGHSERRMNHGESDDIVATKVKAALGEGLTPIICVGESKEVRDKGEHVDFVTKQILASVPKGVGFKRLVVAYEPIWAIGTGVVPTMEDIEEMAKAIGKLCKKEFDGDCEEFVLLYGGSVSKKNSGDILAIDGVNGLLIGGASLKGKEFFEICAG